MKSENKSIVYFLKINAEKKFKFQTTEWQTPFQKQRMSKEPTKWRFVLEAESFFNYIHQVSTIKTGFKPFLIKFFFIWLKISDTLQYL